MSATLNKLIWVCLMWIKMAKVGSAQFDSPNGYQAWAPMVYIGPIIHTLRDT